MTEKIECCPDEIFTPCGLGKIIAYSDHTYQALFLTSLCKNMSDYNFNIQAECIASDISDKSKVIIKEVLTSIINHIEVSD